MEQLSGPDLFEITDVKFNGLNFQRRQELITDGEYCQYVDMKKLKPIWYDNYQGVWHLASDIAQSVLESEWQSVLDSEWQKWLLM